MQHRFEITHNFSLEQCMRCHKLVGCPIIAPDIAEWMAFGTTAVDEGQNGSTLAAPNACREQDI